MNIVSNRRHERRKRHSRISKIVTSGIVGPLCDLDLRRFVCLRITHLLFDSAHRRDHPLPIVQNVRNRVRMALADDPRPAGAEAPGLAKKEATKASFLRIDHALALDDYLAVHTPIVIPTAMPSTIAIVVATDNHRSAFAVNSPKPAIMVAVADPHVDVLCERRDCNTQSHRHCSWSEAPRISPVS
jgi:hypothetical protein